MNETDHGAVTMRIKFIIITGLQCLEFIRAIFCWILRNFRLHCILKVREKTESVFEFDLDGLVVDRRPRASYFLLTAVFSFLAEGGLRLVLVHHFYFPGV